MTFTVSTRFVAFTAQHIRSLTDLAEVHSLPLPDGDISHLSESVSGSSAPRIPEKLLDDLAKEFGVDAQVVHALAKRLAGVP